MLNTFNFGRGSVALRNSENIFGSCGTFKLQSEQLLLRATKVWIVDKTFCQNSGNFRAIFRVTAFGKF